MKLVVTYEFDVDETFEKEVDWVEKRIQSGSYSWLQNDPSKAPGRAATNLIKECGPEPTSFKFVSGSVEYPETI